MAHNKSESWGFQGLAGLLRDLGPTKGQTKVYKRFKELYQSATKMRAGEPPDEWRPPEQSRLTRRVQFSWHPDAELKELAGHSVKATLELRQNKPAPKPSDREKECHGKLPDLAIKMGNLMKLQEEQVRIDTTNGELQMHAHLITKTLDVWANAVSAPDCTLCGPRHKDDQRQNE